MSEDLTVYKNVVARIHPSVESTFEIVVQEPDPYTGLFGVEFKHTVWDEYNKKWLEPRVMQIFMRQDQLLELSTGIHRHFY